MKKILFNLILAGVFMNFGYPILLNEWRDFQFKNSDMEALKNMSADELMNRFELVLEKIEFDETDFKETSKSYSTAKISIKSKISPKPSVERPKVDPPKLEISDARKKILAESHKHIGLPYRYGSMDPAKGFDCSGFARFIYKESIKVNLPRTSSSQFVAEGGKLLDYKDLQPGDLMFFSHSGSRIQHVGIFVESGKFIHAPRTGRRISVDDYNGYWENHFVKGKTFLQ
tara:strand:+ start:1512 stop:2198 length:687 start_codon:yes stop_codon:yes gene_type:complete